MKEFAIAEVLPGKLNALVKNLMAQMGIEDPNEAVRRVNAGEWIVKLVSILNHAATTSVSATSSFSASAFKKDTSKKAKVRIGYVGDNFKRIFLNRVEANIPATTLAVHALTKNSLDSDILAELGNKAETSLAHFYELLARQPKGESGILITNVYANIFYIKDANGKRWAVYAGWGADCGGWFVDAYPVDYCRWGGGDKVFSQAA